jgi:hypothetical protein
MELQYTPGAKDRLTLDVAAGAPDGFSEADVGAVRDNAGHSDRRDSLTKSPTRPAFGCLPPFSLVAVKSRGQAVFHRRSRRSAVLSPNLPVITAILGSKLALGRREWEAWAADILHGNIGRAGNALEREPLCSGDPVHQPAVAGAAESPIMTGRDREAETMTACSPSGAGPSPHG